ncbi:MAG: hypothetical protein PHD79_08820 [Aliarcobacter sp.]|nr:hypothetical protein [Aliarcobacter sp.]
MKMLQELEQFINEFNQNNNETFMIDSIRIEFQKQYKKERLDCLGNWNKLQKNSDILHKLKRRLSDDEVTSVYRLENFDIYCYNKSNQVEKKYRNATMVIFGLMQYHKNPPPRELILQIINVLKDISNIDLCLDMKYKPNLVKLSSIFNLIQYIEPTSKKPTDTYYINKTNALMIDKIVIYNKAIKNKLDGVLWRLEALISIPNIKYLALPLYELKQITDLAKEE